jgi:DNA-binding SARP family transcriptional activator
LIQPNLSSDHLKDDAALHIYTLGGFRVLKASVEIEPTAWGREKALHLFQYLVTNRRRQQHKEQIIDQLWPDLSPDAGDRDFKVALNAINNALEPDRPPRAQPRFIRRFDLAYGINLEEVWIDIDTFDAQLAAGNQALPVDQDAATEHYQAAVTLYHGEYLPERRYEDWTSAERERLGTLALSAMTTLAELQIESNPRDSLRLTQRVLALEPLWEEAYRVQMRAYQALGNRPMALRTYQQCVEVLDWEFGVAPLPETQSIYTGIRQES